MIRAEDLGELLLPWLVDQRWYRAKARGARTLRTVSATPLADGLQHTMVEVDSELYQLPLGTRDAFADPGAVIAVDGGTQVYDATLDPELMGHLLTLIARGAVIGGLTFSTEPGVTLRTGLRARPIGVEQSNTSIVYGTEYILKLYRQPDPGPNRDVRLHRALRSVGSRHIAAPLGVIAEEGLVLGFLQRFLPDAVEGWATATASVRDLLAEADLYANEVGGDFAGEARRLGAAVAQVHASLADALGTARAGAGAVETEVDAMHARLDTALAEVPDLRGEERTIREAFDRVRALGGGLTVQQVHGDLHLGQTLRTTNGWVLIDFEGEPAATPQQRRTPRSPLVDVAGMLRSFDYAAFHLLAGEEADRQLTARAQEWSDRNRGAFCDGYAEVAGDPRDQEVLLRALELDKAVYEVRYEHHNRPEWRPIPLAAIRRWSFL
ncbi:aminoglycoside phosphotransferase [Actinophytocola xinjiangensis]|uniref:Maltokinase n=1 Tax=Actinophytocola xinjiangensis TaxID=485602 RepID=A0A7Z0WK77_9PSEU|nr:aminoglycoside phosphotransferase [Actinophytocola xinjiangensis]OLF08141.1 aminoglycoside phosphotransferase [Actinophytocola xinjiangensis]